MAQKTTKKPKARKKDYNKLALQLHKKLKGKLSVESKGKLQTIEQWSTMYSPGVGAVSAEIARRPDQARVYTGKGNTVAVVSDGSAVLGLGNIGPLGALPVMEGKCAIFKTQAGIDAWPIVLDVHTADEIVAAVKAIAPSFGGINLEDIAAPVCFEVEERLKTELKMPIMHDDQHGTAIVALAGLMNAAKVVKKNLADLKVVIVGAGAAGVAITNLFVKAGISNVVVTDRVGVIYEGRAGLVPHKKAIAKITNPTKQTGQLMDVIAGADVLIGVSGPGIISTAHVEAMAENAIVFALANPIPEINPEDAKRAGAAIVATGRSDLPNQINNSLAFPGIFRGALDREVNTITDEMKLAVAKKIAGLVKKPTVENIVPKNTEPGLAKKVAAAIR